MKPGAGLGSPLRVAPPVQKILRRTFSLSRARHLHHDGRAMETAYSLGLWTRSMGTLVARAKAGFGSVKKRQVGGAVAGSRRLWWGGAGLAAFLAACAFFDVVVDVPVVQIVDVSVQLLDKVVLPVVVQDRLVQTVQLGDSAVAVLG